MRHVGFTELLVGLLVFGCGSRTELYAPTTSMTTGDGGQSDGNSESCPQQTGLTVLASGQVNAAYIALDATHVYWTTQSSGSSGVMKIPKCGGVPVSIATTANTPFAIAVDTTSVYWATSDALMRVPLAGGTATTLATGQINPNAIALGGSELYWVGENLVATPVAGGASTVLASLAGQSTLGIAVDSTSVYWTQYDGTASGAVMRMPVGGGKPTPLASNLGAVEAIAVDAVSVYWTSSNANAIVQTGVVTKIPLTGGLLTTLAVMQNIDVVSGIAVDAESVYWTNQLTSGKGGTVMKVPLGGGTPTELASGQGNPQSIAVDATSVYWVNSQGTVMKLTPN